MISAPMMTLTGVFGLDAFSLYKTEKRFSSISGMISSENVLAKISQAPFSPLGLIPRDYRKVLSVGWNFL